MAEARRLDPTQRAAAAADAPVQLTLAGPGAGKTTTLAVRFVHLVRQGVDPRRILAVTFTRKAAIEMQERIVRLLRLGGPKGLAVDTFHAFAFRHLRRQPQRFGLPEKLELWDVPQQRHVFHARRMWWNEEIDIIDLIGGMKERLIDAAGFARMVGDKSDEPRAYYAAAVEFFNVYEAALRDAGAIDFADMVLLVTRRWRTTQPVAARSPGPLTTCWSTNTRMLTRASSCATIASGTEGNEGMGSRDADRRTCRSHCVAGLCLSSPMAGRGSLDLGQLHGAAPGDPGL